MVDLAADAKSYHEEQANWAMAEIERLGSHVSHLEAERNRLFKLVELAKRMREAQRRYFRLRTNSALIASKDVELEFDREAEAKLL